jgi:outer membrane autotransporter protein
MKTSYLFKTTSAIAFLGLCFPVPSFAADIVVSGSSGSQALGAGDSLTVESTGTVTGSPAVGMTSGATSNFVNNSGTISGTVSVTTGSDLSGGLTNSGTINAGGGTAIDITTLSDISGGITNTGTITGNSDGIEIGDSDSAINFTGNITNSGTITSSGGTGIATGNFTDIQGVVNNSGTIFGGSHGVRVHEDMSGGLINSGTISGNVGILVFDGAISGGITNTGTITGTGGDAIQFQSANVLTTVNLNGGRVVGNIVDDTPANGFSNVVVGGNFSTEGDITVSRMSVTAGNELTISAGDTITLDDMDASAGTIAFEVDTTSSFGQLVVNGAGNDINLTGTTVSVKVGTGSISDGDELKIGDGAAAITGGPGGTKTTVTDNSFLWSFQIADGTAATAATDNTDLFLFISAANDLEDVSDPGNGDVARVIKGISSTAVGVLEQIVENVNNAETEEAINEILEGAQTTADGGNVVAIRSVARGTSNITRNRMASLRTGLIGPTGMSAGDVTDNLTMWAQPFAQSSDQGKRDNVDGYEADTYGITVGVDTDGLSNGIVGVALTYANTEVDSKNATETNTDVDSYQVTVYGDYDLNDETYLTGSVSYVYGQNESTRHNVGGVSGVNANGDFNSHQFGARAEIGRKFISGKGLSVTPSFMLNYAHYTADSYTETGAGTANLRVSTDDMDLLEAGVGVDLTWERHNDDGSVWFPSLHAGYRHDIIGDKFQATSNFTGGGSSFKTEGFEPAQDVFNLGVGVRYFICGKWDISANYDFEYKSDYVE